MKSTAYSVCLPWAERKVNQVTQSLSGPPRSHLIWVFHPQVSDQVTETSNSLNKYLLSTQDPVASQWVNEAFYLGLSDAKPCYCLLENLQFLLLQMRK